MAGAQAFMEGWKRLLEDLGLGEIVIRASTADDAGLLSGTLRVSGSRRLDVYLRLEFQSGPQLLRYSVQLLASNGDCVLRYDNAPHHSDLPGLLITCIEVPKWRP